MPEGDTLWRAARTLHAALGGQVVIGFRARSPAVAGSARRFRVVGDTIARVDAQGKHLLVHFARGAALHTHLGMRGSWHLYRPGSRWRRPEHEARAVIETARAVAVCFAAPTVELLSPAARGAHPQLRTLGPDVVSPAFEAAPAIARLRARPDLEIADALLDQTAVSGIGNIYKSETLFLCGVDPFAAVAVLDDATLAGLVRTAERLMKRNAAPAPRRTTPIGSGTRVWVYERAGRPCRRCGSVLLMRRHGRWGRSTYWCPRCQPPLTTPVLQESTWKAKAASRAAPPGRPRGRK